MSAVTRIHLISGPRNISTVLMYSFRSRADATVFDVSTTLGKCSLIATTPCQAPIPVTLEAATTQMVLCRLATWFSAIVRLQGVGSLRR